MKIFGINITTKKELRAEIDRLKHQIQDEISDAARLAEQIQDIRIAFPFDLGQVVYDIQLKSSKGRYTKTKPSLEHSSVGEVVVDEKNYFSLVERSRRNDVFRDKESATAYLESICSK